MRWKSAEVNLDYVAKKAEERARKPFRSPRLDLPDILRADKLNYDKYREIRFRRDQALWASDKLPFAVEFFHPGYLYEEPVHINEFSYNYVQPIRFVQEFFDYGSLHIKKQIPANTGYAGFRIVYPLNQPDKLDELGAFSRRQLLSPAGQGPALRHVRPRLGAGLRRVRPARGISAVHGLVARPAAVTSATRNFISSHCSTV